MSDIDAHPWLTASRSSAAECKTNEHTEPDLYLYANRDKHTVERLTLSVAVTRRRRGENLELIRLVDGGDQSAND